MEDQFAKLRNFNRWKKRAFGRLFSEVIKIKLDEEVENKISGGNLDSQQRKLF